LVLYIMYFERLMEDLKKDSSYETLLQKIINVFSPYYICQHFVGNEAWKWLGLHRIPGKNDLLTTDNVSVIKDYDIVVCQVNYFEKFVRDILPRISGRIILITCQFEYPQLFRSELTDELRDSPKIIRWLSTNPIYEASDTYMAFPCGMCHWRENMTAYAETLLRGDTAKSGVAHMHLSETNPCRDLLPKGPKCECADYYENIRKSQYLISPIGDRDDCYRHYEAIGLGSNPLSNVGDLYRPIFGDSMIYCGIDEMLKALETQAVSGDNGAPNRDLICLDYYVARLIPTPPLHVDES